MKEGCRVARGDVGVPRMCSAKLERCDEAGLGLEPSLSAVGGVRPIEDTELLREASLTSTASVLSWSAMTRTAMFRGMRGSTKSGYRNARVGLFLDAIDSSVV